MAFTPKTWADFAAGGTPITAAELNRIEAGIEDSVQLDEVQTVSGAKTFQIGALLHGTGTAPAANPGTGSAIEYTTDGKSLHMRAADGTVTKIGPYVPTGSGGYTTVRVNSGTAMTQRTQLNFIGSGATTVSAVDDPTTGETDITISSTDTDTNTTYSQSTTVSAASYSTAATAGGSSTYSRGDHNHGMPAEAGNCKIVYGTYTGDGVAGRLISTGISTLRMVWVSGANSFHSSGAQPGATTTPRGITGQVGPTTTAKVATSRIERPGMSTSQFEVAGSTNNYELNFSGVAYHYVAIAY